MTSILRLNVVEKHLGRELLLKVARRSLSVSYGLEKCVRVCMGSRNPSRLVRYALNGPDIEAVALN